FTTYEKYEESPLIVHKKDGSRELFDPMKLMRGLLKACEKRPVTNERIKNIVDSIEHDLRVTFGDEAESTQIGELVMKYLAKTDQIAYVRFVSVYKQFKDTKSFIAELERIIYDE
ncbi:MAG: ATP cone domain-containing protein, partial [Phascolarctobacterium sp.]|nr:ATP cone domain-containing protein [Phascolarctobacterium sp.]